MVSRLCHKMLTPLLHNFRRTFNTIRTMYMIALLLTICLNLFVIQKGDCLTGFQFEDNLSKERNTPENGNLTFRIPKLDHYG